MRAFLLYLLASFLLNLTILLEHELFLSEFLPRLIRRDSFGLCKAEFGVVGGSFEVWEGEVGVVRGRFGLWEVVVGERFGDVQAIFGPLEFEEGFMAS